MELKQNKYYIYRWLPIFPKPDDSTIPNLVKSTTKINQKISIY